MNFYTECDGCETGESFPHAMNFVVVVVVVGKSKVSSCSHESNAVTPLVYKRIPQITSMYSMRCCVEHMDMHHKRPVQAIWSEESDGTDVNACTRTAAGAALCTGDDFGMVRLFRTHAAGGGRGRDHCLHTRRDTCRM